MIAWMAKMLCRFLQKKKLLRSPHFPIKLETQRGVATPLHWIGPVEFGVCLAEEVQYMEA